MWHLAKFGKPEKASHLPGTIIHDSPLSVMKNYWNTSPWWKTENRKETKELIIEIDEKYESFKGLLNGSSTFARASCPKSDELALRIHKITGLDTDDIEEVAHFIDMTGLAAH